MRLLKGKTINTVSPACLPPRENILISSAYLIQKSMVVIFFYFPILLFLPYILLPLFNLLFLPHFFSSFPTAPFPLLLNQNSMPMAPTTSTMSLSTTVTASWWMWTMSDIPTLTTYKTHCSLVFALLHRFRPTMANLPKGVNLNASIDGFELLELEIQQAHIHKACTFIVQVGFCQDLLSRQMCKVIIK